MLQPIWLPEDKYPEYAKTYNTIFSPRDGCRFCLAEFKRAYRFDRELSSVTVRVSGDTRFYLWINGGIACAGPVAEGGDYGNDKPMKNHYYSEFTLDRAGDTLDFFARVYIGPDVMTDYSQGHGAFMLDALVKFTDGSSETLQTGRDWLVRFCGGQKSVTELDARIAADEWLNAEETENIWTPVKSPIPLLYEREMLSESGADFTIPAGETRVFELDYPRIWAGYVKLSLDCAGETDLSIELRENIGTTGGEHIVADSPLCYRSLRLQSIGGMKLTVKNFSDSEAVLTRVGMIATHYPAEIEGDVKCSDEMLEKIYDVAKHTLKICRQSLHLDSPMHQETLGCTGDYYIESLMTAYTFGDMRLARLDIVRTADWLRQSAGFMFHTAYSLIWLQMAWDYYVYTADKSIFDEIYDAAEILLDRFDGYTDEAGVIQNPPNYMFVDWVPLDGFNMHHPPKCAGQTVLNAFYYKALRVMADISEKIGKFLDWSTYSLRAEKLKESFTIFFDEKRGLYFDGLNGDYEPNQWLPADNGKRYYSKHANSLAVLYGLCPDDMKAPIMEKVVKGEGLTDVQPYFMHFLLEAVDAAGLFGKYGLALLHRFDIQINECQKGMKEGWGEFHGDYSHAWGGTAAYILPKKLLGLKMLSPGFKRVSLSPSLLGLDYAEVKIPTPYGMLTCVQKVGEPPVISAPGEIKVRII